VATRWSLGFYRRLATGERVPGVVRALARAQLLDGEYTSALRRALADSER
jgi:hypothetical protein